MQAPIPFLSSTLPPHSTLSCPPLAQCLGWRRSQVAAVTEPMVKQALTDWGADVIAIDEASRGHALYFIALGIFTEHNLIEQCAIDLTTLKDFLLRLELNYGANEYHNSMHGCDVMLHVHIFLVQYGLDKRLSSVQLLAVLLGALIHDFNHPGTTNAYEVKLGTVLALTYSDQSVLEFHHLASSFALLRVKGYDILSGLSAEDYRTVRALIVELVLQTDLTKVAHGCCNPACLTFLTSSS